MAHEYDPKDASNLWPDGEYPAVLIKAEDGWTKGTPSDPEPKPKEVWTFELYDDKADKRRTLQRHVTFPKCTWMVRELSIALGRKSEFDQKTFHAEDHIGSNVTIVLGTRKGTVDFPEDQNQIQKIKPPPMSASEVAKRTKVAASPPFDPNTSEFEEADIPFDPAPDA